MINNHKTLGEWKIQLSMKINFVSSKDYSNETRTMSNWSNNIEIIMGSETDDLIDELFKSFLQRYQKKLENSMNGSEFVFNSVDLLYYHLQKISLKRGESNKDSPEWLKNKGATINPKNKDNECFKHAITVALNHQNIGKNPQRVSKIKPFIGQYEWKGIDVPSCSKNWKKFEQNNKTIALNILFVPYNTKQIRLAYKSKYNYKRDDQVILLMITDGEKWHNLALKNLPTFDCKKWRNLAVKSLSALLRGITSNHDGDFYCLNCFHSYSTKEKLKKHEKVCNDNDYCYSKMPKKNNKILKYNHGEKPLKVRFIIYADLESLLKKIQSCQNNPEKSSTKKKLSIRFQITHELHVVHLMHLKTNRDITEKKTVWKCFVKT